MRTFWFGLLAIWVWLVLPGCGPAAPTPNFVPIRPDPTLTPTPANPNLLAGAPTSVVSDQVKENAYTHFSNRFSLNYPAHWQPFERPDGVVFLDPGGQAGLSIYFSDVDQVYSAEELNQYLVTFVAQNFAAKESKFIPLNQETRPDGSVVAQFSSSAPPLGPAMNEVRVLQQDTIVYTVFISAAAEQWPISQQRLHQLADTLTPLDTAPAVAPPTTDEPPAWVLVGPTNQAFAFFYPSDWQITRQDESSVVVIMPNSDVVFEASVVAEPNYQPAAETAQKAAQTYIDGLKKQYKDLQARPLEPFQLDQVTEAATIDFLYTAADGAARAGSIITAASQGQIYQVVFSSSAQTYPYALQWFNPMYKSFRILPAGEVIKEPN
jgi:hypothetical protein